MGGSAGSLDPLAALMMRYGSGVSRTTKATPKTPAAIPPQTMQWAFPQYSQSWAFTPPTPTPVMLPPPNKNTTTAKK